MLKSSKLRIWKSRKLPVSLHPEIRRRGARVVEEARLESVYTPKGYHEFESRSLRSLFHEILSGMTDSYALRFYEERFLPRQHGIMLKTGENI